MPQHTTLRGRIRYTSNKPERRGEERGREHFTITRHGDGARPIGRPDREPRQPDVRPPAHELGGHAERGLRRDRRQAVAALVDRFRGRSTEQHEQRVLEHLDLRLHDRPLLAGRFQQPLLP